MRWKLRQKTSRTVLFSGSHVFREGENSKQILSSPAVRAKQKRGGNWQGTVCPCPLEEAGGREHTWVPVTVAYVGHGDFFWGSGHGNEWANMILGLLQR